MEFLVATIVLIALTGGAWALFKFALFPALANASSDKDIVPWETKKHASADLKNYGLVFLLLGFNIAVIFAIILFKWFDVFTIAGDLLPAPVPPQTEEIQEIPITEIPPPPPPVIEIPEVVEVEDEIEVEKIEIVEPDEIDSVVVVPIIEDFGDEEEEEVTEDNNLYNIAEVAIAPEFPGGESALMKYLAENYNYPHRDREEGNGGMIYMGFTVTKTGAVENIRVLRGINSRLDAEAIKLIQKMPKWKPGMNGGFNVNVSYTVPLMLNVD